MSGPRIASLLPSATEIVCALGFQDNLVGRSHECDFPAGVQALPACTRAKIDASASSREIDDQVKQSLTEALSIYEVVEEALKAAAPDVIVTQDQCDVCAVALGDVEAAVAAFLNEGVQIVSLAPMTLDDVLGDIATVGAALDAEDRAARIVGDATARLQRIRQQRSEEPTHRVACIEWVDPLMAAGNWVPELVEIAGGVDVFGAAGQHAPWITEQALIEADPDVIVFMPCGFGLERSAAEGRICMEKLSWQALSAVRKGRVYAVDGNSYFNRPGPRLVDSAAILAEVLWPDQGARAFHGAGWINLADA